MSEYYTGMVEATINGDKSAKEELITELNYIDELQQENERLKEDGIDKNYVYKLELENEQLKQALNEVKQKLFELNNKFKEVSKVPFDIAEIFEIIQIIDGVEGNKE